MKSRSSSPSKIIVCITRTRSLPAWRHSRTTNGNYRRGYRRPGLCIEIALDERLQSRWEGAFWALQEYLPEITEVPPLRVTSFCQDTFLK